MTARRDPWVSRNLARQMGRALEAARWAKGIRADEVADAVGFESPRVVLAVERGRALTRASRLRPWCQLLGIDADAFLRRFTGALAPTYQDAGAGWADPLCSPALASDAEPVESLGPCRAGAGKVGSAGQPVISQDGGARWPEALE